MEVTVHLLCGLAGKYSERTAHGEPLDSGCFPETCEKPLS